MNTINTEALVKAVSHSTGVRQKDTKLILDAIFDEMSTILATGDEVKITRFGMFTPVEKTGVSMMKKDEPLEWKSIVVKFRPFTALKTKVNNK